VFIEHFDRKTRAGCHRERAIGDDAGRLSVRRFIDELPRPVHGLAGDAALFQSRSIRGNQNNAIRGYFAVSRFISLD
jgi:hypothetical protein